MDFMDFKSIKSIVHPALLTLVFFEYIVVFLLILVQKYQVQIQSTLCFFDTQISAILAHDRHWQTETSDPYRNHDVVLRLDKSDVDPLRTLYIMLTFTDMISHSRIAKISVLRYVMHNTVFFNVFFVQMGCKKKSDVNCIRK